jgi:hypothetical protein
MEFGQKWRKGGAFFKSLENGKFPKMLTQIM